MDFWPVFWQLSSMVRSKYRDATETHHTVSAGILDALGRGFLIATAGVVAGALFGTANLAAMGLWTVGVAAASGVGCMVGSALVRNAACNRCEPEFGEAPEAASDGKVVTRAPVVGAALNVEAEERWARRMETNGRQRDHSTRRGI
jgi:hypothetical protein